MANTINKLWLLGEILNEKLIELLETLTIKTRAISSQVLLVTGKVQRLSRKGVGRNPEAVSTLKGDDIVRYSMKIEGTKNELIRHYLKVSFRNGLLALPTGMRFAT